MTRVPCTALIRRQLLPPAPAHLQGPPGHFLVTASMNWSRAAMESTRSGWRWGSRHTPGSWVREGARRGSGSGRRGRRRAGRSRPHGPDMMQLHVVYSLFPFVLGFYLALKIITEGE